MKFACDKCNTRYSIADERVRGRVLKIRCKACNHVITVRESEEVPELPAPAGGDEESTRVSMGPPAGAAEAAGDDWFVSFDGDQEGPLPLSRALDRVRAERPSGKECYCWRAGFFVWLPIEDVPEFASALGRAAAPPLPASSPAPARAPTGAHSALKSPTGSQPKVQPAPPLPSLGSAPGSQPKVPLPGAAAKSPTGPQAPVKSPSGGMPALKSPSAPAETKLPAGGLPPLKSPSGAQPALKSTTGPLAAVKSPTGSQPSLRATGAQAAIKDKPAAAKLGGESPDLPSPPGLGSEPKALPDLPPPRFSDLPKSLSDLPPLDSGPLGAPPLASMPPLPTRPEPRLARKGHDELPELGARPGFAPPALPGTGPTVVNDAPTAAARPPARSSGIDAPIPDTGPVPLPPPPVDDLPIGEASGLISLNHLVKPLAGPSMASSKPVIDTFGGHPVIPTPASSPTPIIAGPGAARGAPAWMKWAALAGAVATVCLLIVVVVLARRERTVINIPPAPTLDDGKKAQDHPITINEPGPTGVASAPADTKGKSAPSKRSPPSHAAVSVKPASETLSASQRNLASLYRDDAEHAAPHDTAPVDRSARGAGGQVSQQAIMAVVTQNRRSLNLCYDRVLKHDSSLKSGRVVTHVKIGISGSVTGVSVPDPQYAGSEIGQCIAQTIKHWHFPSADSEYETEFPIILQAN